MLPLSPVFRIKEMILRFYQLYIEWVYKYYNVRALGSLEAENLFGEFQDLDPKGVGVLRPDDIPIDISTACELLSVRMDAKKSFFMQTSKAKVYPLHELINSPSALTLYA
jgi:hypothetical protein